MSTKNTIRVEQGDNLDVLKTLIAEGVLVDAVVTDPPYALNFMGRKWDAAVPPVEFWKLVWQILKPGGHVLACGGTRTYHRMVVNIEDAGFEIRDCIMWVYGSGMPKSHDVSKNIDNAAGAERKVIGKKKGITNAPGSVTLNQLARPNGSDDPSAKGCGAFGVGAISMTVEIPVTAPATPEAVQWNGWGTGLKPAVEPIVLARKPLSKKNVATNVLEWGTGALNIGACRIGAGTGEAKPAYVPNNKNKVFGDGMGGGDWKNTNGRWPANIIVDEEAAADLDSQSGHSSSTRRRMKRTASHGYSGGFREQPNVVAGHTDSGGASRFFYCAKATKAERRGSKHPTVKPVSLMRYLCRLITPSGGTVLDPFAGTGPTGEAARLEGFNSILIEREPEYIEDIKRRATTTVDSTPDELVPDGDEPSEPIAEETNMNKKDNWQGVACDGDGREFGKNGVTHASSNNLAGQHFCHRCNKKLIRWFGSDYGQTLENPAKALQEREEAKRISKDAAPVKKYFRQLEDMAEDLDWTDEQLAAILQVTTTFDALPQAQRFLTFDNMKNDVKEAA